MVRSYDKICRIIKLYKKAFYKCILWIVIFLLGYFRFISSPLPELQAQEKHWLLHSADLHAFNPNHHPILGILLDQL